MKASTKWFEKAKTVEEKAEMVAILSSARSGFRELKRILEAKKETSRKARLGKDDYSNPSWAYLQADGVGEERTLEYVIKLIDITFEE